MAKTTKAVQRIEEIRVRRQERFYEKRMKVRGGTQTHGARAESLVV